MEINTKHTNYIFEKCYFKPFEVFRGNLDNISNALKYIMLSEYIANLKWQIYIYIWSVISSIDLTYLTQLEHIPSVFKGLFKPYPSVCELYKYYILIVMLGWIWSLNISLWICCFYIRNVFQVEPKRRQRMLNQTRVLL